MTFPTGSSLTVSRTCPRTELGSSSTRTAGSSGRPGSRVTDYLVESKDFIAVTDAEVWELGNRHVLNAPFINVSLDHIQISMPVGGE